MAVVKYSMKQFDLEPSFEIQLLDGTTPIDLSQAVGVLFIMRNRKGLKAIGPMEVGDQTLADTKGVVLYRWKEGDTTAAGTYNAEVQVTWPDRRAQTFPASNYVLVTIQKDLNRFGALAELHAGYFHLYGGDQRLRASGHPPAVLTGSGGLAAFGHATHTTTLVLTSGDQALSITGEDTTP